MLNKTTANSRENYMDVFRAIGIICMIMGHVWYGKTFDKYIHAFHMQMFFFASGFFYKTKLPKTIWEYIYHLSKTLLVPYVIYGMFNYLSWLVFSHTQKDNLLQPLKSMIWVNTEGIIVGGAIWFLTSLFFSEIIFSLCDTFIKSSALKVTTITLITVFGGMYYCMFDYALPYGLNASLVGVGFMYIGHSLKNKSEYLYFVNKKIYIVPLIVMACLLTNYNSPVNMRTGEYGNFALTMICSMSWIFLLLIVSKSLSSLFERGIKWLALIYKSILIVGRCSIVFLCLNQLVIILVNKGFCYLLNPNMLELLPIKILITLIVLMVLLLLSLIVDNTRLSVTIGRKSRTVKGLL